MKEDFYFAFFLKILTTTSFTLRYSHGEVDFNLISVAKIDGRGVLPISCK